LHLTHHIANNDTFISCNEVATNIESNTPIFCSEVTTYIEKDTPHSCYEVATDIAYKCPLYEGLTTMVPMESRTSTDVVSCMLGFQPFDEVEWNQMVQQSTTSSEKSETWCWNKFDAWRWMMKLDCSKKIEELSLVSLFKMLCRFFVMVCKQDGSRYTTPSLMKLYMLVNRILVRAQENQICSTSVTKA
jgi:hypothetical protein